VVSAVAHYNIGDWQSAISDSPQARHPTR
jgi:hypothetical protein